MSANKCCVCLEPIQSEESDVLVMGPYGTPRCLCEDCSHLLDSAANDTDYDVIVSAMDKITEKISKKNIDDPLTVDTLKSLFESYAKRARAIRLGEEILAEEEDEGFLEIPEELSEAEEDRILDEAEEKKTKKINAVLDWVCAIAMVGTFLFLVFRLIW